MLNKFLQNTTLIAYSSSQVSKTPVMILQHWVLTHTVTMFFG